MAEHDTEDGRPGSMGPDLGALGEDHLSADLEAELDGEFGDDTLDEGESDDSGGTDSDGEFEASDDEDRDGDEGGSFSGAGFSGGFGAGGFSGAGDGGGPGFSFASFDSDDSGDDLFDFGSDSPEPGAETTPKHGGGGDAAPHGGPKDTGASFAPRFDDKPEPGPDFDAPRFTAADDADFVAKADRPSPSDFVTGKPTRTDGKKSDDEISGDDGSDVIRGFKGDDTVDGASGDDWLRGGHGDDDLTGGPGSDVVDGEKGNDTLNYTLGVNGGATDFYDGGKGTDTLTIKLDPTELTPEMWDELQDLRDWMAENANDKRSTGHAFNDAAARSAGHPIYATSFGLTIRNIEELELEVEGFGPIDLDGDMPVFDEAPAPEPEPDIEPDPEPTADPVVVDVAAEGARDSGPSTIDSTTSGDGALSVEALSVTLRPGSQATISVDVEVRELPAIYDVFMLQDLSGSFWDDLPNVKEQFGGLYDALNAEGDVQFGVGSFIDKPVGIFGSDRVFLGYDESGAPTYTSDYVYQTHMSVSGDKASIQDSLDGLSTRYGVDWREAQLEGLVQVALRGAEIGFRDGAQKFVVLSTDAAFHQEGDYADASMGANDYDTEIEDEDYPEVVAVGELLEAAGIIPVFAVTEYVVSYYQELVDIWGFGSVTVLSADSSNLATAITDGLKAATTDLNLTIGGGDYGYVSSMTPGSYEDVGAGTYTFDITLEIPEDSVDYASDDMTLVIAGYGEIALEIAIESVDATGDSGDDTLTGDDGVNGLYGLAGADRLDGRGGDDILVGGSGDDTMTGGLGDDVFVFADGHGNDTITDFLAGAAGGDVIDLRRLTAAGSFIDVMAAAVQIGGDTVIDFGDGNSIALLGVDSTQLEEQDFLF